MEVKRRMMEEKRRRVSERLDEGAGEGWVVEEPVATISARNQSSAAKGKAAGLARPLQVLCPFLRVTYGN
jgi:hypothetical protein